MDKNSFTHLHCHTEYSLLDSPENPRTMIKKAKELGMDALAITEHGNMMSYYTFYNECVKEGIKPIIGVETYVLPYEEMLQSEKKEERNTKYHLVLLAKDNIGLQQLIKAVTASYKYQYKSSRSVFPRMTYDLMKKYFKGGHVICLSACMNGEIGQLIINDKNDEVHDKIKLYMEIFGKENYFLEVQNHGIPEEEKIRNELYALSKLYGLDLVASNDCHYAEKKSAYKRDLVVAMRFMTTIYDENFQKDDGSLYIKDSEEMASLFPGHPEVISNTKKIADMCNVTIKNEKHFPVFQVPEGMSQSEYLEKKAKDNIRNCYPDYDKWPLTEKQAFDDRLEYELDVIRTLKYDGYLLIVQDFIEHAIQKGMVGPGRGSAVGSLTCRLLEITNVDPIKYNLIFERFLNKERVSDPDIDTDFDPMHRDEVISYVKDKYGKNSVASIITLGTLAAKASVRATGRVLGIALDLVDSICKLIPNRPGITITQALDESIELKNAYDESKDVKELIDKALMIEGIIVQTGVHAAGIIIADRSVSDYIPLMYDKKKDIWITQLDKDQCEAVGLLKMDFLGLETLNIIIRTLSDIKRNHGVTIKLSEIPLNDKNVLQEIFAKGNTKGVFQFESMGMIQMLKRFQPQSLEDLILLNAAFRPGPIQYLDEIIDVKHGRKVPEYIVPEMKEILDLTYGKPIYQEQIMQIFNKIAGFSLGTADIIRRAMSKKKTKILAEYLPKFEQKLIEIKATEQDAKKFSDELMDFASYAFNKSHAAAYAWLAYYTGWFKYYYPVEFMANILNSTKIEKLPFYLKECKNSNIPVLPPSVNESGMMFTPTKSGTIRFGLGGIKFVGKTSDDIINERETNGPFQDIFEFIKRMYKNLNKRPMESLIAAGAFDDMKFNRNQMLKGAAEYKDLYKNMCVKLENPKSRESTKEKAIEKVTSFVFEDIPELEKSERLKKEMELIGYYATGHPLDEYEQIIDDKASAMIGEIDEDSDGYDVCLVGKISDFRKLYRKKDKAEMGSFVLEDLTGEIKCICFTKAYERNKKNLKNEFIAKITGKVSADIERDNEGNIIQSSVQIIVEQVDAIEITKYMYVRLDSVNRLPELKKIITNFPGNTQVNVLINGQNKILVSDSKINFNKTVKTILLCKFGPNCISFKKDKKEKKPA